MNDENEILESQQEEEQPEMRDTATDDLFVPDQILMPIVEALIFASETPVSAKMLKTLLDENKEEFGTDIALGRVVEVIDRIKAKYEGDQFAFEIVEIADGYYFMSKAAFAPWIGKLFRNKQYKKLSQASLETLAIVSYKQPISKPEIEQIRGVNADYAIKNLMEKNLITMVGRSEAVGKPLLYGTTKEFLMHFGLKSIEELPKPREISEIMKDEDFDFEQQMKIKIEERETSEESEETESNTETETEVENSLPQQENTESKNEE